MATVEEYQARNEELNNDIDRLRSQASSYRSKASASQTQAVEWRNQKGNRPDGSCGGTRRQKAACEEDKVWKESKAKYYDNRAESFLSKAKQIEDTEIPALRAERATNTAQIESQQESSEEIARELSRQGLTFEGVTNQLTLRGEGEKEAKQKEGQAKSAAIIKDADAKAKTATLAAETDAQNKKNLAMVGVAIGVVLVVIGAIFAFKKIKKLKKAKK